MSDNKKFMDDVGYRYAEAIGRISAVLGAVGLLTSDEMIQRINEIVKDAKRR